MPGPEADEDPPDRVEDAEFPTVVGVGMTDVATPGTHCE